MTTDFRLQHRPPPPLGPPPSHLTPRTRALLEELSEIFASEGFAHLTMGDLAARLGCSYRTLYSLAPSRQELVLVVIDRILRAKGRAALEVLSECHDPATRLEALIEIWAGDFDRISLRYAEDAAGHPAVTRLQNDHQDHAFLILRDVIEDGIASGQFRPMHARIAADVINAGLARIRDPEVLREAGVTPQQAVAELLALILRGFGEGPR